MITLENGNRKIDFTLGSTTVEAKTISSKDKVYTVTLPTVICNNEQDAKIIESMVNEFVFDLTKKILSKED